MTVSNENVNEKIINANHFYDLIVRTYSDVCDSFEVLENYKGDIKYILSLEYLKMSHDLFLELRRFYQEKELFHREIEPFFSAYDDYKYQLKEFITEKDTNITWVHSAINKLADTKEEVEKFIGDYIESNIQ
jgi:hypothetical protein